MNPTLSFDWSIDGSTRLLGVIGDPVHHSLSPAMHNLALQSLGLNYRYLPFHISSNNLAAALRGFKAIGLVGFNATIPHKEALLELVDEWDPQARLIGAVNTVHIRDGRAIGYNTDGYGFLAGLRGKYTGDLTSATVILLGAGGAARAVLAGLLHAQVARIFVANRSPERAERLVNEFRAFSGETILDNVLLSSATLPLSECDLLVNSTRIGLAAEPFPEVDPSRLAPHAVVYDLIYARTPLLKQAESLGLKTINGLEMLIHQGARAFAIWTGQPMPVDLVRDHLLKLSK